MDIGSEESFPAGTLSNFSAFTFTFDEILCASMEGLVQAFKSDQIEDQVHSCSLIGIKAKRHGQQRNEAWKSAQKLWWQGQEFDRHGQEYQDLIDRAFDALFTNEDFQQALRATGNEVLTHSIGNADPTETILTEAEFCDRLMKLRTQL